MEKQINKKKIIIIGIILLLVILIGTLFCLYIANVQIRNWIDQNILRKNITEENLATIDVTSNDTNLILAYDKYICTLDRNILSTYSNSGKKEFETTVTINSPIYSSNNRFLTIAEKEGQKVYLISGQNILWQNDVKGQISQVSVNKNGYVSVIVTGTTHKTSIITFDPEGTELFYTFLSSTIALDVSISNDNKYLAIAEIDTSKSMLQSYIKIISIEKAKNDPDNAIDYIYPANSNEIIADIYYQDKDKLICRYDDSVHLIQNKTDTKLLDINSKTTFCDIRLKDHLFSIVEKSSGLFADVQAEILNVNTNKYNIYSLPAVVKEIYTSGTNAIAINLGTEVHFIDTNGWLIKKYTSNQEIKHIVIGSSIAGIVYKDTIKIINI